MYDVITLGELLVDFTPAGLSPAGMPLAEQNPGGAVANMICALAGFGRQTGFIGKVGTDMHGKFLRQILEGKGVDTRGLISDPSVYTTLAFVSLSATGERDFSFARKPGADTCLREADLDTRQLKSCRVFHFGSLSLTDEPCRSAHLAAVRTAKNAGAIISYDPNYRAPLWPSEEAAIAQMRSVLDLVDVIKISDEETALLTGKENHEQAAQLLLERGIGCVVVTLGSNGAYAATRHGTAQLAPPDVPVVDTTGAGDAFWGGFIHKLLEAGRQPAELQKADLEDFVCFANCVASLCVEKRGGIPAMPSLPQVAEFMAKHGL